MLLTTIESLKNFLWSGPLLALMVIVGLYLTFALKGVQFRYLLFSLKSLVSKDSQGTEPGDGDLSAFAALMTALSGAIGTGNITGVALAISIGGYGALFWMWLIALIGMVTAYSECLLAVKFRTLNDKGQISGGPMHTLSNGLGQKKLAILFCIFGIIASFGIGGTVQSNSVAYVLNTFMGVDPLWTGLGMGLLTVCVVIGGIQSIGKVAGVLVPFMALFYVVGGLVVIGCNWQQIPQAVAMILTSIWSPESAAGGVMGATIASALSQGVSIGIFANEAGLGSLAIASSAAATKYPARQGFMGISGVFVATMVICTITGLSLAVTDVLGTQDATGASLSGAALTIAAFNTVFPGFGNVVLGGLCFFAFTTILAWAYYGEKCLEFLLGVKVSFFYRWCYSASVVCGPLIPTALVWASANLANGLMAIPNLISLLLLVKVIKSETDSYLQIIKK